MPIAELLDDLPTAIRLYEEGALGDELAERYGLSRVTVLKYLRREGVAIRKPGHGAYGHNKRLLSRAEEEDAAARYVAGERARDLAERFGVSHSTMKVIVRRHGVARPGGRPATRDRHLTDKGYVRVLVAADDPLAPMRNHRGFVPEHRLVMARALNRLLTPDETVHHINGVRDDNRIENLELRHGKHGNGQCYECADCGSRNIRAASLSSGG